MTYLILMTIWLVLGVLSVQSINSRYSLAQNDWKVLSIYWKFISIIIAPLLLLFPTFLNNHFKN